MDKHEHNYRAVAYFVNWCIHTSKTLFSYISKCEIGQSTVEIIIHKSYQRTSLRMFFMPLQMLSLKVEKCTQIVPLDLDIEV